MKNKPLSPKIDDDAEPLSLPLPWSKDDSSKTVPLPLAQISKRAGRYYSQVFRENDAAVFLAKHKNGSLEYEVIKIQIAPPVEFQGRKYPWRETFPPTESWGYLGFTFTSASHGDPENAALAKARQLSKLAQ